MVAVKACFLIFADKLNIALVALTHSQLLDYWNHNDRARRAHSFSITENVGVIQEKASIGTFWY